LLDMKARVEGIRALGLRLTMHVDQARVLAEKDPERAIFHKGQTDLLTPIFKAYATDQGFLVAVTAIQTYGGAGFLKDHPAEQYCRDSKIFSIYEGTNHIQALDLVGRKLRQAGGKPALDFLAELTRFADAHAEHPRFSAAVGELRRAQQAVGQTIAKLFEWGQAGDLALPQLVANRILEMMAELAVAWLLLDGATIAHERLAKLADTHPDRAFYLGRCHSAVYYALNILPGVHHKAEIVARADRSALDIPDDAFATL
jgi:alkylation response protein AidB-like acyl-CoA dehydrogenase